MGFDYSILAYTEPDVLEKIKTAEKEGRFNDHLDPIESDGILPVDEKFPYRPGVFLRFVYWLRRTFFLNHFIKRLNEKVLGSTVTGKENLKGLGACVIVCNHVNKFDGLCVNYALGRKKFGIMVAEFNNRPGFLGKMMRADGIMPFKNSRECIKKFNEAVQWNLSHKISMLFFPEGSEWWCYKKPRPFMDGAFHYASQSNVPVLPVFITFTPSGRVRNGVELPDFHINILKPVYPDSEKTRKENTVYLKEQAHLAMEKCYESFYGEKLN